MSRRELKPVRANPGALSRAGEVNFGGQHLAAYGTNATFEACGPHGRVLATFYPSGLPAVLQTPMGAGSATQFAWQPGVSYLINASKYSYIPDPRTQLQTAVRELIVGLTRTSCAARPDCEHSRWDGNATADIAAWCGCDAVELGWRCRPWGSGAGAG